MTNIEISSSCKIKLIKDVAKSIDIDELIESYGNYNAKISCDRIKISKNGNNLKNFTNNILIVLNRFSSNTLEEINIIREFVREKNISF